MPWVIYDPYFQTLWIKKAEQMDTKKHARTSILGRQVFRLRSLGSFELFRIILSRSGPRRGHFSDIERGSSTYKNSEGDHHSCSAGVLVWTRGTAAAAYHVERLGGETRSLWHDNDTLPEINGFKTPRLGPLWGSIWLADDPLQSFTTDLRSDHY